MGSPLIQEFLKTGKRRPSTLSALERRWFVGRLTLAKAQEKHDSLPKEQLSDPLLGGNLELLGTAGLFRMASPASGSKLVAVRASRCAGWYEFMLHVPVGKRGKAPFSKCSVGGKVRRRNNLSMGIKKYFVHADVVEAAKTYVAAFETRQNLRNALPVSCSSTRSPGADDTWSADATYAPTGATADTDMCRALSSTIVMKPSQPSQPIVHDVWMHMEGDSGDRWSEPGETYAEPDGFVQIADSCDTQKLPVVQEPAYTYTPFLIDDDLQWIEDDMF